MIDLWAIIQDALLGVLRDAVNGWLNDLSAVFGSIIQSAFYLERIPALTTGVLDADVVRKAIGSLYFITVGLLVLKLLWKGYKVYILWRDGDAEVSPAGLLLNSGFALGTALLFPALYDISVAITMAVVNTVLSAVPGVSVDNFLGTLAQVLILTTATSFLYTLFMLIIVILSVILCFQMLGRGVSMLIYRLGVPLAVVGLVDSDGGIWKSYIQLFFRQLATILIQYFCICIGIRLAASMTIPAMVSSIVFLVSAFKTPRLFSTLLVSGGGGGGGGGILSTVVMAVRMFAGGA